MGSAVRIGLVGLALAAVGCDFESTEIISNGSVIDSVASATAIAVESRPGDNVVVVRTVDAAGIGSGPGNASVQIDGSAVSVSTDAFGYGIVELEGGVQTVEGEDIVTFDAAAGWPEGLPLLEVPRPDAVEVARARKGVLVSAGSQIWWTGPDLPDHPVADLGAPVRGLRAAQLDDDGAIDALAWGGDAVWLLRGRNNGGVGFGAGVRAEGWSVLAAAAGDLDDDGRVDLAIAWDTGSSTVLQAWIGDGAYGFEPIDETTLPVDISDMAIARDLSDGRPVLTALVPDAEWQRFRLADGVIAATGNRLNVGAVDGSRLLHAGDFSGDGVDDLVVASPRREGAARTLEIWDLAGEAPLVVRIEVLGGWFAAGDATGDGVSELWLLDEDGTLRTVAYDLTDGQVVRREAGTLDRIGPIAIGSMGADDSVPDLLVASPAAWMLVAGQLTGDALDRWQPALPSVRRRGESLVSELVAFDDDARFDEVAGVVDLEGALGLRHFAIEAESPVDQGTIALGASRAVVDLAGCGADVWVLLEDEVVLVDLSTDAVVGRQAVSGPRTVACAGPGQAVRGVVTTDTGTTSFLDGFTPDVTTSDVFADAAIIDGAVVGCTGGCVAWPQADGSRALVTSTPDGLSIEGEDSTTVVDGSGRLQVQDSDGDGELELWVRDDAGAIRVVRQTEVGPIVEQVRQSPAPFIGPAIVASGPGGVQTLWFMDEGALLWLPGG